MTFRQIISTLKQELKDLAILIRSQKNERGPSNNGYVSGLESNQWSFRVKHIAYCTLRGTPFESIEDPVKWRNFEEGDRARREGLQLAENLASQLMQEEDDETVYTSA